MAEVEAGSAGTVSPRAGAGAGPDEDSGAGAARSTVTVRVRYFAAAKAAAGVGEEQREVGDGCSIDALFAEAGLGDHPVLRRSTFLVNGVATTDRAHVLSDGDLLDVLPPFAGG